MATTTSSRPTIIAGNWKMNYGPKEAAHFAHEIVPALGQITQQHPNITCILCVPAISLAAVRSVLDAEQFSRIELAAQNIYFEEKGAFTGEISAMMVQQLCSCVILGHSERRTYFGESDDMVNKKLHVALKHALRPIVCIGEQLEQYEAGETEQVIRTQMQRSLAQIPPHQRKDIVIAYEPVWAIGSGRAATASGAGSVIAYIRRLYSEMYGREEAATLPIIYGGSVTSANICEFMAHPEIDGALPGGASIKPDFVEIVRKVGETL